MRKLAPLFAFLIAAMPTVALAQDPLFDRINLKLRDGDKTVDVTVTKDGKATFVFPDRVVETRLTADQLSHLERNVKGVFTRGSPATDLGGPPDKRFELLMETPNGMRWRAKGPIDVLRGGNLPAVYHVVEDIKDVGRSLPPAPGTLALPAPAERLMLPAPAERLMLPAPPERLLLPAPKATAPTGIVFVDNGRRVVVLPESGELVVTTRDGTEYRLQDRATVDAVVKAATDARLADYNSRFRVRASSGASPFSLFVTGPNGALSVEGPLDVATWNSPELRASVGPIVGALERVSADAEAKHVEAVRVAEERTKGNAGFLGLNRFVESFKEGAASFQNLGVRAVDFLKTTAIPKTAAFLSSVGSFFKGAWDRIRGRNGAEVAKAEPASSSDREGRGFSRTAGMADALDVRVKAEAERSKGRVAERR
ncbi:MAG: hypothetical protein ACAI25_19955 [Planctomycetota bacterium]